MILSSLHLTCYNWIKNILSNRIIIIFEDEFYDVSELKKLHPNAEKIFKKYHMKDITHLFYNTSFHEEIKNPKKILEKYKINKF